MNSTTKSAILESKSPKKIERFVFDFRCLKHFSRRYFARKRKDHPMPKTTRWLQSHKLHKKKYRCFILYISRRTYTNFARVSSHSTGAHSDSFLTTPRASTACETQMREYALFSTCIKKHTLLVHISSGLKKASGGSNKAFCASSDHIKICALSTYESLSKAIKSIKSQLRSV